MRKKNSAALYLALPLLIAVPVLRADPIRAPVDWNFDDGPLRSVSVNTFTQESTGAAIPPADNADVFSPFALRWDWDHHRDAVDPSPVPEPGTLAPFLILAVGFLYFRKRLAALS